MTTDGEKSSEFRVQRGGSAQGRELGIRATKGTKAQRRAGARQLGIRNEKAGKINHGWARMRERDQDHDQDFGTSIEHPETRIEPNPTRARPLPTDSA